MQPMRPQQNNQTNPLHVTFKNPAFPANFISPENVLDYFCHPTNQFYDTQSCNEQVRMQNIQKPLEECLVGMVGIQYIVWNAQHPLYVICKHRRNSAANVTPLAYYYIINGTVYQAPDLHTVVQSRLLGALDPMRKAFDEVMQFNRYNVAKGYYWEFKEKPVSAVKDKEASEEEDGPTQTRSSHFQKKCTERLMRELFDEFPPSSALELVEQEEEEEGDEKKEEEGKKEQEQ